MSGYATILAWAYDFIRAVRERPWWARQLLRITMGKLAYREFLGMMEAFKQDGHYLDIGYLLENEDYHKDQMPTDFLKIKDR